MVKERISFYKMLVKDLKKAKKNIGHTDTIEIEEVENEMKEFAYSLSMWQELETVLNTGKSMVYPFSALLDRTIERDMQMHHIEINTILDNDQEEINEKSVETLSGLLSKKKILHYCREELIQWGKEHKLIA